jgi:hypothetical protein
MVISLGFRAPKEQNPAYRFSVLSDRRSKVRCVSQWAGAANLLRTQRYSAIGFQNAQNLWRACIGTPCVALRRTSDTVLKASPHMTYTPPSLTATTR